MTNFSFTTLSPVKTTKAYDTYWYFAFERQNIFFKRFFNSQYPWSLDPIFNQFKFTNAYRASDRVSQYLIKNVIYNENLDQNPEEVFFRIMVFKIFNKIETWELLKTNLQEITYKEYSFDNYNNILNKAMIEGTSIYSGAYIMSSGGSKFGFAKKHSNHLKVIEMMMQDDLPYKITECKSLKRVFELLLTYPTFGKFLAFQLTIDLNYSELIDFDEMDFVVPGPGALDGIRKCFTDLGGLNETDIIALMADRQEEEFKRLGYDFKNLFGRDLKLIDCQNLFCEVDKYSRVAHPEINGLSGRVRIKQRYICNVNPIEYWYPPKWGVNDRIEKYKNENI